MASKVGILVHGLSHIPIGRSDMDYDPGGQGIGPAFLSKPFTLKVLICNYMSVTHGWYVTVLVTNENELPCCSQVVS
jgi:hypothetical protein